MMKWLVIAMTPALAGCSFGVGSAFVGQWRARNRVDFEACLEDEAGRCVEKKEVVTRVPARSYWGLILTYPAMGAAFTSQSGRASTRLRGEASAESIMGTGRWELGARGSAIYDLKGAFSTPLTGIGHYNLSERLSIYGGAGYSPFSQLAGERAFVGARGLAGMQLALSRARSENYVVVTLEADTHWLKFSNPYRSTGLTGSIGVFF